MNACRECRDPKNCIIPQRKWFSLAEIRFCQRQIFFLLENLYQLREGYYPTESNDTGYTDSPHSRVPIKSHAYFENPCSLAAEVTARLKRCGRDRSLAEDRYCLSHSEDEIARKHNLDLDEVIWRIDSVVWYVTGWRRKATPYKRWLANKKHRGGMNEAETTGR